MTLMRTFVMTGDGGEQEEEGSVVGSEAQRRMKGRGYNVGAFVIELVLGIGGLMCCGGGSLNTSPL